MTDEALKALVAENSLAIGQLREEAARQREEAARQREEDREEAERRHQEFEESRRESERIWQEVVASRQDFDRALTSFNRELGRIGNALGDYSEAMFRPSLERVLNEQFGMTVFHSPLRLKDRGRGDHLEIDMLAHAGDDRPEVYVVEIKSKLRQNTFEQLFEHLRKLPRFLPEHRGKKLFGILAAFDIPEDLRKQAEKEGVYLATIRDDVFEITSPDDFEPHVFGLRGLG